MAAKQVSGRTVVLAALAVVAAVVLVAIWPRGTADTTGNAPEAPRAQLPPGQQDPAVPEPLGLDAMNAQRSVPANRRDLFRFGSSQPAPNPDVSGADDSAPAPAPGGRRGRSGRGPVLQPETPVETGPPAPPPITLRYVGYAEDQNKVKIAALSDGRSTFHGREGAVIEGRWRIVKIGVESIVMERIDGTGRQTIRLAGG